MKNYKQKLKVRIIFSAIVSIILIAVMIVTNLGIIKSVTDFSKGFVDGFCVSLIVGMILSIIKYIRLLKNKELLKKEYIKENDELTKNILAEAGANEYYFIIVGLLVGTIVGGYINKYIFWSFYIALMYYCFTRAILFKVHKRKYNSENAEYEDAD